MTVHRSPKKSHRVYKSSNAYHFGMVEQDIFNQRRHYKLTGDAVGGANTTGESVMGGRVIGVLEGLLLGLDDGEPGVTVGDAVMVTKTESTASLLGLIIALITPCELD